MSIGKSVSVLLLAFAALAAQGEFRLGIIGCDTSHTIEFARIINVDKAKCVEGFRVTCAYKFGSPDIVSSTNRYPKYLAQLESFGVKQVPSIAALLAEVDGVLLETNDGRPHYAQALEVFKSGKPCFIDKPVTGDLADAIRLVEAAKKFNARWFCTSSLRFMPLAQQARRGELGKIRGAECWSPELFEPTQSRYYWYAVHAAEPLFTIMGTGCESVSCVGTGTEDVAVGAWKDGRLGTMRALHYDKPGSGYGAVIFCEREKNPQLYADGNVPYEALLETIAAFFRTGKVPVSPEETLELYAFLAAAEKSYQLGGKSVRLSEVLAAAKLVAAERERGEK